MPCHSVPTSPAMVRTATTKGQPVTPQRLPLQRGQHRHSASQTFYRSPITPASPYTPLSLRSFTSSGSGDSSSLLNTPDTSNLSAKQLSFSPEFVRSSNANLSSKDTSLADIADNWRSRAVGDCIKAEKHRDESHLGDDEASRSMHHLSHDSGLLSAEEALLAPAFLASNRQNKASHRNRPRAQSQALPPTSQILSSPMTRRTPDRSPSQQRNMPLISQRLNLSQNADLLRTPPPNKALSRQVRLKGSFTDPVNIRKRGSPVNVHTPRSSANKTMPFSLNNDPSLDLFDIDENDMECDYEVVQESNDNILRDLSIRSNTRVAANPHSNPYGYPDFSLPTLSTYPQQRPYFSQNLPPFDPFQTNSLTSITEGAEHYFNSQRFSDNVYMDKPHTNLSQSIGMTSGAALPTTTFPFSSLFPMQAAYVPLPAPVPCDPIHRSNASQHLEHPVSQPRQDLKPASLSSGCSVCLTKSPPTLAVLIPCNHPLCSGCLTSALNIVGEKDMECAVCKGKVDDFKLISGKNKGARAGKRDDPPPARDGKATPLNGESFMDPLFSSPGSSVSLEPGLDGLDSAFEFQLGLEGARASTPKPQDASNSQKPGQSEDNVVLRIDNVPWDITPLQIQDWLQQPLERVHVLLDKKGKTMSHAYIEVATADVAGKILRGEVREEGPNGMGPGGRRQLRKAKERGSVLGKGRRARGVTVTKSGQEELMANLFPSWKGLFDSSRPSLAGLANDRVITALEGGLIGESEVVALLHLIKEPDSHFLKVPCLPFYSLTSLLSKIPSDVDSRVFINANIRDILFDVAHASLQVLVSRVQDESSADKGYTQALVSDLVEVTSHCKIFTTLQFKKFGDLVQSYSLHMPTSLVDAQFARGAPTRSFGFLSTPVPSAHASSPDRERSPAFMGHSDHVPSLAGIAKEFGVEPQLVQALVHRLANADL